MAQGGDFMARTERDREPVRSNRQGPLYNCTKNELGNEVGTVGEFSTK